MVRNEAKGIRRGEMKKLRINISGNLKSHMCVMGKPVNVFTRDQFCFNLRIILRNHKKIDF